QRRARASDVAGAVDRGRDAGPSRRHADRLERGADRDRGRVDDRVRWRGTVVDERLREGDVLELVDRSAWRAVGHREVGGGARRAVTAGEDAGARDQLHDSGGAGLGAVGIVRRRRETVRAAGYVDRRRGGRQQNVSAAATTAGTVALTRTAAGRLQQPRVAALAAFGLNGESRQVAR